MLQVLLEDLASALAKYFIQYVAVRVVPCERTPIDVVSGNKNITATDPARSKGELPTFL